MGGSSGLDTDDDAARISRVYARYLRSRRKQRAWAAENPGNAAMRGELTRALIDTVRPVLTDGGAALDVGCGTGWALRALAEAGVPAERLHGVDLIESRVRTVQSGLPEAHVSVADARQLPVGKGSMAAVIFITTLSSMKRRSDLITTLAEARRVLAPGGVVVCYEPRVPNPLNPNTRFVRVAAGRAVGLRPITSKSLTLVPPIARRLGRSTARLYPLLSRMSALRSHRLVTFVEVDDAERSK